MTGSDNARPRGNRAFLLLALVLAAAGAGLGYWWQSRGTAPSGAPSGEEPALERQLIDAGIDPRQRAAFEGLVRAYILDHPEIIPEAIDRLRQKEAAAAIAPLRGALETPFPGAVLGNPQGKVTLVEFTDFACTFCRHAVADLEALIAANPDLRVVVRELPIISPQSEPAARMALAAAAQGKYAAFHRAMFAGESPGPASIEAAARAAGLDLAAASAFMARPETGAELGRNLELAKRLGINGTPAWVVGERFISGAVGKDQLQEAVTAARKGHPSR